MSSIAAFIRRLTKLEQGAQALRAYSQEPAWLPPPNVEEAREVVRILIAVGRVETDGTRIWWKKVEDGERD